MDEALFTPSPLRGEGWGGGVKHAVHKAALHRLFH